MALNSEIRKIRGRGLPLPGNDIDTDRIIPARYLKFITFEGLGPYAFYDERYEEDGKLKDHPFNDTAYAGASILLAGENFGCGSSREHAPQALHRAGIDAVVGESFAEIFAGNCNAIGVPTVACAHKDVSSLMDAVRKDPSLTIEIDLEAMEVRVSAGGKFPCRMPDGYRNTLLEGSWDTTAVLMKNRDSVLRLAGSLPGYDR